MKAIIVGGGVAGPAVALALQHVGVEAVVLERRVERHPEVGSYFTVAPNGLDALDLLGGLDVAREIGFATTTNTMYGATGRRLGELSLGVPLADGSVALTAKRSLLAARLLDEAERRGIGVRRGADVADVASDGGRATVRLTDGERLGADLVVGADGVRSGVRSTIDPGAPRGRYVGLTNFGGITRRTPLASTLRPEAWHFVFGARAFFGAHATPDGDVVWFVNVPEPEISRERRTTTTLEEWQRRLLDLVAADAGPAADLVADGTLELAGDNTYDLPHVPHWTRDGLVVVGDAAHAPSPSSGQGASMALEDAVVLATSIRDHARTTAELPAALHAYEQARRARVERIVKAGARSSSAKTLGPVGRRFQEAAMSLVFRYLVTDRSTAWMTGSRLSWGGDRVA
jgi:2-polyprenyl-6-methoxyphenol hydroxylase-like FAD-dependent oxidoreductase